MAKTFPNEGIGRPDIVILLRHVSVNNPSEFIDSTTIYRAPVWGYPGFWQCRSAGGSLSWSLCLLVPDTSAKMEISGKIMKTVFKPWG